MARTKRQLRPRIAMVLGGAAVLLVAAMPGIRSAAAEQLLGNLLWNDRSQLRPIPFADIRLCREDAPRTCHGAVTGSDGSFTIRDLAPGRYRLEATYAGGRHVEPVAIAPGQTTSVSIVARD